MIFVLDAYNAIHKIPTLERLLDKSLQAARDGLVTRSSRLISGRGGITKIILVFDGKSDFRDLPNAAPSKIQIVFSETGETADERIGEILEGLSGNKNIQVVSDDNSVRNHARAYAVQTISVAQFDGMIRKTEIKASPTGIVRDSGNRLTPQQAAEITQAYKKSLKLK